jgi:heterotetrameric sarcosine oxidase delta subunit
MIRIPCPHCGPRDSTEFKHAGNPRPRPAVAGVTPQEWRRYLYEHDNVAGWVTETWYHSFGCRRFVTLARHTVTNEIVPDEEPSPGSGRHRAGADPGADADADAGSQS